MADPVIVRVEGLGRLNEAVEELTGDLRKKVVVGALRDAARPIVTGAKQRAPVLRSPHPYRVPGVLRRNIAVFRSKTFRGQDGVLGVYIRVRRLTGGAISAFKRATGLAGRRNPFDPFYWWFLEFGTRTIAPRRFLAGAFQAARLNAVAIFERRIGERIRKANERRR